MMHIVQPAENHRHLKSLCLPTHLRQPQCVRSLWLGRPGQFAPLDAWWEAVYSFARPLGNDRLGAERVEFMPQVLRAPVGAANEFGPSFPGPDKRHTVDRITLGIGPVEDRHRFELKKSSLVALDFRDALD